MQSKIVINTLSHVPLFEVFFFKNWSYNLYVLTCRGLYTCVVFVFGFLKSEIKKGHGVG